MSKQNLARRIETLEKAIPPIDKSPEMDLSLFTEQEQARFQMISSTVLPKLQSGVRLFDGLSEEEFFTFSLWMNLYQALQEAHEKRIIGYRYRLTFSTQQVIEMFLSLSAHGETDEELHKYTPAGLVYSYLARTMRQDDEKQVYHYLDEIWQWCINAGQIQPLYYHNLRYEA